MKIASTFFAIVTCLCAIVALCFSAILFSARNDKVIRADMFAQTLCDMVKVLDEGSGTTNAAQITFKPGDAVRPASGTLSNANFTNAKAINGVPASRLSFYKKILAKPEELSYKNFQEVLNQAVSQAQKIVEQRDRMAEEIFNACSVMEIPSSLQLNRENLTLLSMNDGEVSPYEQELKKINQFALARKTRDVFVQTSLITIGKTLGVDIAPEKFTTLNDQGKYDLETEVNEILNRLATLKTHDDVVTERFANYVGEFKDNLRQLGAKNRIFMNVDPDAFGQHSNYSENLNVLRKDYEDIVTKLSEMTPMLTQIALVNSRVTSLEEQNLEYASILNNREKLIQHILKTFPPSEEDKKHGKILTINVDIPKLEKGYKDANLSSWNAKLGFGVINKGRLDGIERGMVFLVVNTDIEGRSAPIAEVRVSEVRDTDARAEFVKVYTENYINKIYGDEQLIFTGEKVELDTQLELEELDMEEAAE